MDERSVETDVDDRDEADFHQWREISSQLYFSMFVNLSDEVCYDVAMNSRKAQNII